MAILYYFIVVATNTIGLMLKMAGYNATSAPGLLVERYFRGTLRFMSHRYEHIIMITGTNGKSTVSSLLAQTLNHNGIVPTVNISGSNMLRGIATVLARDFFKHQKYLILEVEEATMPRLITHIKPHIIVVTNIFRDQLDAYGEINKTKHHIQKALEASPNASVVINGDDPQLVDIAKSCKSVSHIYLGNHARNITYEGPPQMRVKIAKGIEVTDIFSHGLKGINIDFISHDGTKSGAYSITSTLFGGYNAYNICFAFEVLRQCGMQVGHIIGGIHSAKPHFGRGEELSVALYDRIYKIKLFLVKNPAGFNEVWRLLKESEIQHIVFALNSNTADGRDVSWIWDAKIEGFLPDSKTKFYTSGDRRFDAALRLKYANIPVASVFTIEEIGAFLTDLDDDHEVVIIATYTALNEIRRRLKFAANIAEYK